MREDEIQRAVFANFKARRAPGVFAFHPKNGGIHQRGRRAGINTGLGVIPGVPDVLALKPSPINGCCWLYALELKAEGGVVSTKQRETMQAMRLAGAIVDVTYGLDDALRWLEQHGLLQGRAA